MKKILAKDFGLVPNVRRDSTKLLARLLEQFREDTIFELEQGEYHFYASEAMEKEYILSNTSEQGIRYCSIVLENMKNIVIEGQGAELIFHGKLQPLSIHNCSDITVHNIDIDWEIPLTAEGVVVDCKESYVDLRIDTSQFPYYIKENKLVFTGEDWDSELWKSGHIEFDSEYKQVGFLSGDTFPETTQEELSPGLIRFHGDFKKTFICRNNYFGSGRARGLLVSTPKPVLIENNIFESSGTAILIAGDANFWYKSGACHDVMIKNNMFNSVCLSSNYMSCEGILSICPEILEADKEKPFHSNIYIEGNVFTPFDYPVLYAKSTTGLWFNNNRILRSYIFEPWHSRRHMLTFEYCSDVNVSGNIMVGNVLGKDVNIQGMVQTDVQLDLYKVFIFRIKKERR